MLSNQQWITMKIKEKLPDAEIDIQDPRGDDQHLSACIRSCAFKGKPRVQCHQMIYGFLEGMRNGQLHALSLKTEEKES